MFKLNIMATASNLRGILDNGAEFLDKWFSIPKICQYFRTRSPVTMADIDDWHAQDLIDPLFFNNNTDLHNLPLPYWILPPIFY